jgi:glycine/D-amino acid oxidase-like deaminating enzyme
MSVGHGGTGILMAPVTGQALATWIATGRRPPSLDVYRLRR